MRLRKMSPLGDETLAEWDVTVTPERLKEIEREFDIYRAKGWFAADLRDNTLAKQFNPDADLLLIPRMSGGTL